MTGENTPDPGGPTVAPPCASPHHERTAELTDGQEARTSESPPSYSIVRAGKGWPEVRPAVTESRSDQGRETDVDACIRGAGEGLSPVRRLSHITPASEILTPHGTHLAGVPSGVPPLLDSWYETRAS
jgi:hypothetical protein